MKLTESNRLSANLDCPTKSMENRSFEVESNESDGEFELLALNRLCGDIAERLSDGDDGDQYDLLSETTKKLSS